MTWRQLSTYRYICLSTDIKVTEGISFGSYAFETDTDLRYVFDGSIWTRAENVVIMWEHKRIHLGKMWRMSCLHEAVAVDGNVDLVIEVGSNSLHSIFAIAIGGAAHCHLYEAPTVTAATGTASTVTNASRPAGDAGAPTALKNPTITDLGTLLESWYIAGGTTGNSPGGFVTFNVETILKFDTKYLFRAINKKGQIVDASWNVHAYEFT